MAHAECFINEGLTRADGKCRTRLIKARISGTGWKTGLGGKPRKLPYMLITNINEHVCSLRIQIEFRLDLGC